MFLPYQEIKRLSLDPEVRLVEPFSERTEFAGVSYGCGPASYDLRIDTDITLWPGHSVRVDAIERIHMPPWLVGQMFSKSTWARKHVEHASTIIDPGFGWKSSGILRLEINMHHGDEVIEIKAGTAIVQVLFSPLVKIRYNTIHIAETEQIYTGKYQGQGKDQDAIFQVSLSL